MPDPLLILSITGLMAQVPATLVAWRRSRSGLEVLMGRRAGRHRFVPHH